MLWIFFFLFYLRHVTGHQLQPVERRAAGYYPDTCREGDICNVRRTYPLRFVCQHFQIRANQWPNRTTTVGWIRFQDHRPRSYGIAAPHCCQKYINRNVERLYSIWNKVCKFKLWRINLSNMWNHFNLIISRSRKKVL